MKIILRKIINFIIPDLETRMKIKNFLFPNNTKFYQFNKAKWGVSYSVWDGEELLEASINSIRKNVDYINVVWQKSSWFGEPCSKDLEPLLVSLKEKGLIDELIFFEPDLKLKATKNELNKRNVGLHHARKAGCTHFMPMDADEFYLSEEFEMAKDYIIKFNLTHTACNLIEYPSINFRRTLPASFFVPFFHRITGNEKFVSNCCVPCPWLLDPKRQIPVKITSRVTFLHMVRMHHFVGVRKDLVKKYRNSSSHLNDDQQQKFLEMYEEKTLEEKLKKGEAAQVPNIFGICIK